MDDVESNSLRGTLTVVSQDKFIYQDEGFGSEILQSINLLRQERLFTDGTICAGHEEFPCHRNILAASSPYFKAMFTSQLREDLETRVSFNEISPWIMRRILDYIYTGQVEITIDNAQELLAASNLFQYNQIVIACCKFLSTQLHPSNCLGFEEFAHLHNCSSFEKEARKYSLENFSSVVEHEEFPKLSLVRVMSYISSDWIDVRKEETVYEAVMSWLNYDIDSRKCYMYQLLELVRLPVVELSRLCLIEKDSLIKSCEKCILLVKEAQEQHETIHDQHGRRRRSMQNSQVRPRPSTVAKEKMVVVAGWNTYVTRKVEMFDPEKEKWHSLPDFPTHSAWFSVCALSNSIYVTGGILNSAIIAEAWRFDSVSRSWLSIDPMLSPRARHASDSMDDRLYVIGGNTMGTNMPLSSIECYDPVAMQWTEVGVSSFPRTDSRIFCFMNKIIEVGGLQGGVKVNTLDTYMYSVNDCHLESPGEQFKLPEPIQFAQLFIISDIIYIIWEDSKKLIQLNPVKRTFHRLADMHYAHRNSGATVLNGKIYITGGTIDSRSTNIVESYDPVTNEWTIEKSMCETRSLHGCVTIQL